MARRAACLVAALLCGCPPPAAPEVTTIAPDAAFAATPPAAAAPAPAPAELPPLEAVDPLAPDVGVARSDAVELRSGGVLRPSANVSLGLAGALELAGARRARVSVGDGALGFEALIASGERVRGGAATLELERFSGPTTTLRWRRGFADRAAETPLVRAVSLGPDGALRVEEMGLYRLADGRVIAIGNVVASGDAAPAVVVSIFPADYARDPMQGYDRHYLVRAGETLEGERARLELRRVEAGDGAGWGWVELRVL